MPFQRRHRVRERWGRGKSGLLPPQPRGWLGNIVLAFIVPWCGVNGCRSESATPPRPSASRVLPQASATAVGRDVVVGFRVTHPEQSYARLAPLVSRSLPRTLAVAVAGALGFRADVSGRLASGAPWYGVLLQSAQDGLTWAMAIPVVSGRELVAELSLGVQAPYRATQRGTWVELVGSGGPFGSALLGVGGNFLLVGSASNALEALHHALSQGGDGSALAPVQTEPGVSARLFASRTVLQALHAHWSETLRGSPFPHAASPGGGFLGATGSGATLSRALPDLRGDALGDLFENLQARVSAYLGLVEGGELSLRWQGRDVLLEGQVTAPRLPFTEDSTLCRELSALPPDATWWVAGVEADPDERLAGKPDWDEPAGSWQRSILEGMVGTAPLSHRLQVQPVEGSSSASWVLAWLHGATASAALAILSGVPLVNLTERGVSVRAASGGKIIVKGEQDKTLEWVWAPRGGGTALAAGAPLGQRWTDWISRSPLPGWPRGIQPHECQHLVAAAGTGATVVFSAVHDTQGLDLRGRWTVTATGGVNP